MGKMFTLLLCGSLLLFSTCVNSRSSSLGVPEQLPPAPTAHEDVPASVSVLPGRSPVPRARNFAFIFRSRLCGVYDENVLDTANGTLVHTPIGETTAITIPLRLKEDEMNAIYQKIINSRFFSYPADLRIPEDQVTGIVEPSATYHLRVTNGTQTNAVTWTDDVVEPKRADIERFRELVKLIEQTMQAHPEMQNLPEAKAGCA